MIGMATADGDGRCRAGAGTANDGRDSDSEWGRRWTMEVSDAGHGHVERGWREFTHPEDAQK